ncbi:MAG: M20/M25/M40 family metallo-hydrolase, partial [Longimicrobiales bacterium]
TGTGSNTAPNAEQYVSLGSAFDSAYFAWDAGDYPTALRIMDRLLRGSDAARHIRSIAELTGEVFVTTEVAGDGRAVRWSPDGRSVAYETGSGDDLETHVVGLDADGTPSDIVRVSGAGLVFSADGRMAAWLYVPQSDELDAARAQLAAAGSGAERRSARAEIARIEAATAQVCARGLPDGPERTADTGSLAAIALAAARTGDALYLAAEDGAEQGIYRLNDGAAERIVVVPGDVRAMTVLAGNNLLVDLGDSFAIVDTRAGTVRTWDGEQAAVSADGRVVAFVRRQEDGSYALDVLTDATTVRNVLVAEERIAEPALSADGARIVYQQMPREDWELYVKDVASDAPARRLTRGIQHDLFPIFLADGRVVEVKGEGRHRRSYLYSPEDGTHTRLFHNNTVRTVAPEYEWQVSPDGTRLLIVAERDGDTISPERGVYMMDLTRTVGRDALIARVAASLAAEEALRANGRALFAPIADQVAAVTAEVSTGRIYDYANDLFAFGSKFITQPGNTQAIDYLSAKLREFGYQPELQWFEPRPGIRSANVIARLPGTVQPDVLYVVSSHFDSVERGPGADDNSSGTTALLEAARVFADEPQPATIEFAFFTGEEAGLLGSREFVRRAVADGDLLVGALNNDMVGFRNDSRLDNTIRYSNAGIRDIQHAAAIQFSDLITYDAKYYKSTDAHAYFEAYGDIVGGIGSYPILANPHYHQTHDHLETIDQQLVAEVSKTTVATLMLLASSPSRVKQLTVTRSGANATAAWAALPEKDIAAYEVEWGPSAGHPRGSTRVDSTEATLRDVRAGDVVRVRAVNRVGLPAWD